MHAYIVLSTTANELQSTKIEFSSYGAGFMEIVDIEVPISLLNYVYKKISVKHNHLHGTLIQQITDRSLLVDTGDLI